MLPKRIGLTVVALLLFGWLLPLGPSHALETSSRTDSYVVVQVPAVPDATQLWVDVEAPGLAPSQVVVRTSGAELTTNAGPFGVTGIVAVDGTARTLEIGLRLDLTAKVAITLADGAGRILHSDAGTLSFTALSSTPPERPTALPSTGSNSPLVLRDLGGQWEVRP